MEVGWEDCFPCWSLRSEGSGKKLAIYGARLARRKRGETEVNSKWYSLFVAHVHHDRPRHSKTDDRIIIKSMENDDVVLDAQSIRIC